MNIKIKMTDIHDDLLMCFGELNSLLSNIMDNHIRERFNLKEEDSIYEFLQFKESVQNYKFEVELFNENKKYNLERDLTKNRLNELIKYRKIALNSLKNLKNVISKTVYIDFREDLKLTVNLLVESTNIYLTSIRDFLKENYSELEYNFIIKNYELDDIDFEI